ncbi:MAG: hypothetical protein K2X87_11425 [Gemmataceae bacterium]|nr:hypothetical protein [Gemmataceae bacterium]
MLDDGGESFGDTTISRPATARPAVPVPGGGAVPGGAANLPVWALLEISTDLSRTLELDPPLGKLADTLLGVFKQADRCFVVLLDDAGKPVPRAQRARRPGLDETRFSRTIVKKAVETL